MSENRIHVSLTIMMWAGTSTGSTSELVSLNNASFTADFKITVHGGCPHPPIRWSKMIVTCPPQGSPTALSSRGRPPRPSSSWSACSLRTGRPSEDATEAGNFQDQKLFCIWQGWDSAAILAQNYNTFEKLTHFQTESNLKVWMCQSWKVTNKTQQPL